MTGRGTTPTTTMWAATRERMYEEGKTWASTMARRCGVVDASRMVLASTKAGDLCHDAARGALDALLYAATSVVPSAAWCGECDRGVKHVHGEGR